MRWILILPLLFVACISCKNAGKDAAKKDSKPPGVDVMIAQVQDFPASLEVNGTVLSEEMIELHPEISGRITYLNLPDGALVKEGTLLVRINDADLQAQLQQQNAAYDLAKKTEDRMKQLLDVKGIDQASYDAALNELNSREAAVNVLKAQIDKTVIKAPFDGKLGLRQVSPGAYVTPQTLLGTLQQFDKTKIDFTVPEAYTDLVQVGKKVNIQTNSSDARMRATISAVEPQINASTRNIKARAHLDSGNLYPGAFVKVLLTKQVSGIVVPSNTIIPDAQSNQVLLVKNGKGMVTNVETGVRTADIVEITKGISEGDSVIVSGVLFVRPNSRVMVKKIRKINELR